MTRDKARKAYADAGFDHSILTKERLARLRKLVDTQLRQTEILRGTCRAPRTPKIKTTSQGSIYADMRCKSYYFDDRQAITFESDGFVGFAGWADSTNVQPFLKAFMDWLDEVRTQVLETRPVEA